MLVERSPLLVELLATDKFGKEGLLCSAVYPLVSSPSSKGWFQIYAPAEDLR